MMKNARIVKRKIQPPLPEEDRSLCRVILVEIHKRAKNFHDGLDGELGWRHPEDQGFFTGTAPLSRLGRIAVSIITVAGPDMGVAVRTGAPALTTTTGGTMTGPSRAGIG